MNSIAACVLLIISCSIVGVAGVGIIPTTLDNHTSTPDLPNIQGNVVVLPEANLTLIISDQISGTIVQGVIHFGFMVEPESILVGFDQYPLVIEDGDDAMPVTGISYNQRFEYPFAYAGEGVIFDNWKASDPVAVSGNPTHPSPIWDETSQEGQYSGPIWNENVALMTTMGYVVEYTYLTLCFANGESASLESSKVAVGVNFTLYGDEWIPSFILEVSSGGNVTINASEFVFDLDGSVPIDPNWVTTSTENSEGFVMSVPPVGIVYGGLIAILVVMGAAYHRRMINS